MPFYQQMQVCIVLVMFKLDRFQLYLGHFLEQLERLYLRQSHTYLVRKNPYDVGRDSR